MARYVLLEFTDNGEADAYVMKKLKKSLNGASVRVVGYFVRPTKFCECGHLSDLQNKQQTFYSRKTGLHIHRNCGRPRKLAGHSPRNLLDPEPIGAQGHGAGARANLHTIWRDVRFAKRVPGDLAPKHPISVVDIEYYVNFRTKMGRPLRKFKIAGDQVVSMGEQLEILPAPKRGNRRTRR